MSETDKESEQAQAEQEIIHLFHLFLLEPSTRCVICFNRDVSVKYWTESIKHGRVFICGDCVPHALKLGVK